ncbi:MAG: hypothetical protein V4753_04375 [Pseudomonadota bacterium]
MPKQDHATTGGAAEPSISDLLTETEAAAVVGLTVGTLQTYRKLRKSGQSTHLGPEFIKVGAAVFYTRAALKAYRLTAGV